MGALAHEWYGRPSDELTIIAVTGTNGKTSATHWLAESLNTSGVPCASIGTLGVCLPKGERIMQSLTTPDVFTMHESLARIRDAKINLVVLEASSIGLDQGRLEDRKSTRLNSSHVAISYAVFCLKKKTKK